MNRFAAAAGPLASTLKESYSLAEVGLVVADDYNELQRPPFWRAVDPVAFGALRQRLWGAEPPVETALYRSRLMSQLISAFCQTAAGLALGQRLLSAAMALEARGLVAVDALTFGPVLASMLDAKLLDEVGRTR